jgi:hypothetical protein
MLDSAGRRVEAVAVERHELGIQVRNPVNESGYQMLLRSLANVRGSERVNRPVIPLSVGDERTDAYDRVADVLRELVADGRTDLCVRFSDEVIGGRDPLMSGTVSRSQTMTLPFIKKV